MTEYLPWTAARVASAGMAVCIAAAVLGGCGFFKPSSRGGGVDNAKNARTYTEAERDAREGRCDRARKLLASLDARWSRQNEMGVKHTHGMCTVYHDGDIVSGEAAWAALASSGRVNAAFAATSLADLRAMQCDFDAAFQWAYGSKRPSYMSAVELVTTAEFYSFQGRTQLAARNAEQFLAQYPANWYRSGRSDPPKGWSYDRDFAHAEHQRLRARAWTILLARSSNTPFPPEEATIVRAEVLRPSLQTVSPAFMASAAGIGYEVMSLDRRWRGLQIADVVGLSPAEQRSLRGEVTELARRVRDQLARSPDHGCSDSGLVVTERALPAPDPPDMGQEPDPSVVDSDGDGLVDAADRCPQARETFNGVEDGDGCPDEARVAIVERQIVFHQKIHFDTAKDTIKAESFSILDEIAGLLVAYPQVERVRIEGHTDERGAEDYNRDLSGRRAAAVARYLVGQGVEDTRMTTIGFGEDRPLAFGSDDEAWSQNRRVEFLIQRARPILIRVAK